MENNINKLFEDISFKEIIVILSDIDNKILSLHECSSEDFLTFNMYLKMYSAVSDSISSNAMELYKVIAGEKNTARYNKIEQLGEELNLTNTQVKSTLDNLSDTFRKLVSHFDNLFIPLRNFSQNLLTLKFVNANLEFNLNYYDAGAATNKELFSTSDKIKEKINNIKLFYPEVDAGLFQLKAELNNINKECTEMTESFLPDVENIVRQTENFIRHLKKKHDTAVEKIPQLTQKTKNYFDNIEKIITNLQYHDIIRQKMEHIQDSHKDIILQLEQLEISEGDENIENKIKSYIKIRDIIGLQVAQLIHTNRQYQTAMSIITQKFQDISADLKVVSDLCKHFALYTSKGRRVSYQDVHQKLIESTDTIMEFSHSLMRTLDKITHFNHLVSEWSVKLQKVFDFTKTLDELVIDSVWSTAEMSIKQSDIENIIQQIKFLSVDILRTTDTIKLLHDKIILLNNELYKTVQTNITQHYNQQWHDNFTKQVSETINDFESDSLTITRLIDENTDKSIDFNIKIKASIEQVRYYDFFENIIEDIVNKLNELSGKLNLGLNIEENDMNENLSEILRRYTTYSEYNIFTQYTGTAIEHDREIDIELDDGENIDTDDDNLELF